MFLPSCQIKNVHKSVYRDKTRVNFIDVYWNNIEAQLEPSQIRQLLIKLNPH